MAAETPITTVLDFNEIWDQSYDTMEAG